MDDMASRMAERDVGSVFLYTHEAHPGEHYPHLTSMEQKFRHARELRDVLGVTRPILVDALDGACHRFLGSQPNMTWIFTGKGTPVYKAEWTDAQSVQNALDYFLDVKARREGRETLVPFRVERADYRTRDAEAFHKGLARNGPKAVSEFREAFGG